MSKAFAVFLACTIGGALAAFGAIVLWGILFQKGGGAVGDGILYLGIIASAALLGSIAGLFWAQRIAFPPHPFPVVASRS